MRFTTEEIGSAKFDYRPIESLKEIMLNHKTKFGFRVGKNPSIIYLIHKETNESWQFKNIPEVNRFFECLSLKKISINKFKRHASTGDSVYDFTIVKYNPEDAPSYVFQAYK